MLNKNARTIPAYVIALCADLIVKSDHTNQIYPTLTFPTQVDPEIKVSTLLTYIH